MIQSCQSLHNRHLTWRLLKIYLFFIFILSGKTDRTHWWERKKSGADPRTLLHIRWSPPKFGRISGSVFENFATQKLIWFHVKISIFSYCFKMWSLSLKNILFFSITFLPYDEVLLSSLLGVCYHYLVFMDPVNGYSKSKLLLK